MKVKASRVLGIDSSTNSVAWCLYFNRKPIGYGEIMLEGSHTKRLGQIRRELDGLLEEHKPDLVAVEAPVFMHKATTIKLAKIVGAIESCVAFKHIPYVEVLPTHWQYDIGNDSWKVADKRALYKEIPKRSKSWYAAEIRRRRKQFTIDYFKRQHGIVAKTDNIADAMGVARYAYFNLTRR